jgi:hypothetical protein
LAHYPVNHHLRGAYRTLAGLAGLYLVVFGVIGLALTWGQPFFHRGGDWILGMRTNPAMSVVGLLTGIVIVGAALIGGNLHHRVNLVLGWGLLAFAVAAMAVIQTEANILDASMVNIIVSMLLGLVVLSAALYGQVDDGRDAERA